VWVFQAQESRQFGVRREVPSSEAFKECREAACEVGGAAIPSLSVDETVFDSEDVVGNCHFISLRYFLSVVGGGWFIQDLSAGEIP
jgi:hypothetical protein